MLLYITLSIKNNKLSVALFAVKNLKMREKLRDRLCFSQYLLHVQLTEWLPLSFHYFTESI